MFKERMTPEELAISPVTADKPSINGYGKKAGQHRPNSRPGGKARLVHVNEQVREYIRSAERSVDHHADTFTPASNASLEALLMTLAKEMTSSEQKQFTSLLVREGITGLLQRLGYAIANNMKRLRSKMTTEELAECLGVARQTVNRWIREQHWKTENFPASKADAQDSSILMPACGSLFSIFRFSQTACVLSGAEYANAAHSHAYRQIIDAVENMSAQEQENWRCFYRGKVFADF